MTEPNFDRVARIYRWAEYLTLGPLLQRTRTHYLPQITDCRRAFVLGDGDGRFLNLLLQNNPSLQALAVDTSASMLHLLRQRCLPNAGRLQTLHASALKTTPPSGTDLIVTHFFLDCLSQPDLEHLATQLAGSTAPGTLWLLSDFALPLNPLLKLFAALYIRSLYLAFHLLTGLRTSHLPDTAAALTLAGFEQVKHHATLGGLLYTDLWRRL